MVKVGDIVNTKRRVGGERADAMAVVTKVNKNIVAFDNFDGVSIEVVFSDGETGKRTETSFIETGRHIDIQSILDSIRQLLTFMRRFITPKSAVGLPPERRGMKEKVITVDFLLKFLKDLSAQGYGDMKIKCKDSFLHEDEISVDFMQKELVIDGNIFHIEAVQNISKFCSNIEKAKKDFYERLMKEQKSENGEDWEGMR